MARLLVVAGLVASGKSTVARRAAEALGAELLSADETRRDLFDHGARDAFVPGFSRTVYAEVFERARALLAEGRPVVLDGTFRTRALRAEARTLAAEAGVPFLLLECRAGEERCRERLRRREQEGGEPGWLELFDAFLGLWEPVTELPAAEHAVLDTSGPLDASGLISSLQ